MPRLGLHSFAQTVLTIVRDPVNAFYLIFVYGMGLLVRLPSIDAPLPAAAISSLVIDTILIVTVMIVARQVLERVGERFSVLALIAACVALAFITSFWVFYVVSFLRGNVPYFPSTSFDALAASAYFAILSALYYLQYMWVRQARLTNERAFQVVKAERQLALSELRRLRTQIQPHFLFNVLNNIQIEIGTSPKQASKMVTMLADHLRNSLDLDDTLFVSLEADLHTVRSFIALQQMRFGTDIKLHLDVDPVAGRCLVPTFLLLPLVENATKFGERAAGGVLDIRVAAWQEDDVLTIVVSNTGNLTDRRKDVPGTQTGLSNLRGRLALHYPERHRFDLVQAGEKVEARIELQGEPC